MKSWLLVWWAGMACVTAVAQEQALPDSLEQVAWHENVVDPDTLDMIPVLPGLPTEYVPGDETPELLADRLACLQRTIPLTYNSTVHAFINFFLVKDREYTRMVIRRKDLYFPLFEQKLREYNLPEELKYLAIVESGLDTRATSRARAVGLWQFMAPTGRYMGLRTDWYVDERMDPEKSTDAACRYLLYLYNFFHDWELTLAAYNSGPGTVRKAIRRSGYKKSFWEVYRFLPRETRAYVPQFIAIAYALNYAEQHNLFEPAREQTMPFDTLRINHFVNLETIAGLTGTCMADLQQLNPSLLRKVVPENGRWHTVRVPLHTKAALRNNRWVILDSARQSGKQQLEALAKQAVGNTHGREQIEYRVKSGDVLGSIALRHRVSVADIRQWNNLAGNMIRVGQRLVLWVPPSQPVINPAPAAAVAITPDNKTYTVQPGDTLWGISNKFQGLTIQKIKTLNNLKSSQLKPGQKLIIG